MPKYTKESMTKFINEGLLDPVEDIDEFLENCNSTQKKILLMLIFLIGARPCELIKLKKESFKKDKYCLTISIETSKRGMFRKIGLPMRTKYVQEIWDYVKTLLIGQRLFWTITESYQVRNIVYKATDNKYPPYFFRHNRFSIISNKGASPNEIKYLKGARNLFSVEPYIHISEFQRRKLMKYF